MGCANVHISHRHRHNRHIRKISPSWLRLRTIDALVNEGRKKTAQEMAQTEPQINEQGRPEKGSDRTISPSSRGETAEYLVRRLKRDAPEVAEALARGDYKSARAAAVAAGIVHVAFLFNDRALCFKRSPRTDYRNLGNDRDGTGTPTGSIRAAYAEPAALYHYAYNEDRLSQQMVVSSWQVSSLIEQQATAPAQKQIMRLTCPLQGSTLIVQSRVPPKFNCLLL